MAFSPGNLSVLTYANGFTLWHYKAGDDLYTVLAENYFAPALDILAVGDIVMLSWNAGSTILSVGAGGAVYRLT